MGGFPDYRFKRQLLKILKLLTKGALLKIVFAAHSVPESMHTKKTLNLLEHTKLRFLLSQADKKDDIVTFIR